jgi:L-iditol 2-dehydrogenase
MKGWVLRGVGDLRFEDVQAPIPKQGETLVRVRRAGICSSDIPRVFGAGAYHYPMILGHEFSGETEDGRRVGVFPLMPCFKCESCKLGRYETCENYSYIGSRQNGAFAEYVAVPEWNLMDIPERMSLETAALLEPAAVALHAVRRLDLHGVSYVAVIGAGAIGRLIAKWLAMDCIETVELLGREDKPSSKYYDACVEAVGSVDSLERCVELVRPNGQIVLVGNPRAEFVLGQKLYWQMLRKQIVVRGSWNSTFRSDWERVIEYSDKLRLEGLISHRFAFSELDRALDMMRTKTEKYGKVVIVL